MWARTAVIGAGLIVWVIVRLALRRRVVHPWIVAFALAGIGAAFSDASTLVRGAAAFWAHALAVGSAFSAVAFTAEGLRRRSGSPPSSPRTVVLAFSAIAASAFAISFLPAERIPVLGGLVIAVLLLNALVPLLYGPRRGAGSLTFAAAIVIYAVGRSVIVAAHVAGADVRLTTVIADVVSAAVFAVGLAIFAVEDVRDARSEAAVGHGQTVA